MASEIIEFTSTIDPSETINGFFKGKNVFITGGSGFMGKVLVEKLLRCCPDIAKIYLLLRPKAGQAIQQRVKTLTEDVLFGTLKKENPKALDKIVPISGDIQELKLGMSEEDRRTIIESVTIVYHVAASIKFNEPLSKAIILNTRGTTEACDLALNLTKVDAFMHVSTAYSQLDKGVIEEKIYKITDDWRKMIEVAEKCDPHTIHILSGLIKGVFPNTYTYTKSLAEAVVVDMCEGKIPTIICRPTIVSGIASDPIPGWQSGMTGPIMLSIPIVKGLLRVMYSSVDCVLNSIPVDSAINGMIKVTRLQQYLSKERTSVYNCTTTQVSINDLAEYRFQAEKQCPPVPLWNPSLCQENNRFIFTIKNLAYHLIPALIIDIFLKCKKSPLSLVKIQRKILIVMILLETFMTKKWTIKNDKFLEVDDYLHEEDVNKFVIEAQKLENTEYYLNSLSYCLPNLFNEKINKERNSRMYEWMYYIDVTIKLIFYIWLLQFMYHNLLIPFCGWFMDYIQSL